MKLQLGWSTSDQWSWVVIGAWAPGREMYCGWRGCTLAWRLDSRRWIVSSWHTQDCMSRYCATAVPWKHKTQASYHSYEIRRTNAMLYRNSATIYSKMPVKHMASWNIQNTNHEVVRGLKDGNRHKVLWRQLSGIFTFQARILLRFKT